MFRFLKRKNEREPIAPQAAGLSAIDLLDDPKLPISLKAINRLDEPTKQRLYRVLLPPNLLHEFDINPISWRGPDQYEHVTLEADVEQGLVQIAARHEADFPDPFVLVELEDNRYNGIDLNLILISDPYSPRFDIDVTTEGESTLFGTVHRHVAAEEEAKAAGLSPGQIRAGLKSSRRILEQIETFLLALGHRAYYLEPLTYVSAWHFERRGFAYVSGHKLMEQINKEFAPGGQLAAALDGSTPFRQPEQAQTVRGRAWAIQDGILAVIDERWNGLRMVKRLGRDAGVNTFPEASY